MAAYCVLTLAKMRAMSLEIRSEKVERLAQQLATATGEDVETAVERAIEERLSRQPRPLSVKQRVALKSLFERMAQLPVLDARPADEIIGYGPDGLPS